MNEQNLLENIKEKSNSGLNELSDETLHQLLNATIDAIDKVLEEGDSVEIDDFGMFSRRKHGANEATSVSFFRPFDRLNDRINRKK